MQVEEILKRIGQIESKLARCKAKIETRMNDIDEIRSTLNNMGIEGTTVKELKQEILGAREMIEDFIETQSNKFESALEALESDVQELHSKAAKL